MYSTMKVRVRPAPLEICFPRADGKGLNMSLGVQDRPSSSILHEVGAAGWLEPSVALLLYNSSYFQVFGLGYV
jgi:hypothetical protein